MVVSPSLSILGNAFEASNKAKMNFHILVCMRKIFRQFPKSQFIAELSLNKTNNNNKGFQVNLLCSCCCIFVYIFSNRTEMTLELG